MKIGETLPDFGLRASQTPEAIETVNALGKFNRDVRTWDKIVGLADMDLLLLQPAAAGWNLRRIGVVADGRQLHPRLGRS